MSTSLVALTTATVGGKAFWFLTRASGLVAIVLLSATIVLGVVASIGWTTERWPRFLSQDVHRNVSLLCIVFVGIHVVTTVADGYVPIGILDVFVPFRSAYRPIYLGLGALCLDLLLAVLVTSALRHRIGYGSWRFVHWLAYLCWPIALVHGLGSGTDTPLPVVLFVEAVCTLAVLAALAWRLTTGRSLPIGRRTAAAAAAAFLTLAIVGFAALGPLRPGWSHRSGTAPSLLAQLAARNAGTGSAAAPTTSTTAPSGSTAPAGGATGTVPAVPFTTAVTGTQTQTTPDPSGAIRITLTLQLQDAPGVPLTIVLDGAESGGGGVSLSSGSVTYGPYRGTVVGLNGGTVTARVSAPTPVVLVAQLQINQRTGALSGTVSGSAGR